MIFKTLFRPLLPLTLALTLPLGAYAANALQTEVIKPKVGHKGLSGVQVISVTPENEESIKVAITLPERSEDSSANVIEEIVVVGHPDSQEIKQVKPYEVVNDLEQGRSGIVIYLDKLQDFALTINYSEPLPDVIPDRVRER